MMMEVVIGIDPHKATNAVAAVDGGGKLIELASFATNQSGLRLLERWAKRFEKRCWAVEGAGPQELLIVWLLVLLVFGPTKASSVARDFGRFVSGTRGTAEEVDEVRRTAVVPFEALWVPWVNKPAPGA